MAPVCDLCGREAVISVRYSGRSLCVDHFNDFYEKRVKRELRDFGRINGRIAVAVSGGKDSMALLHVLQSILGPSGVDLTALTIDEGISGYRDESLGIVQKYTSDQDIKLEVAEFSSSIGAELDGIITDGCERGACSYCGVFRRALLNTKAREMDAEVLATGHNLDDIAQTGLMNFLRGDIDRMLRTGPHRRSRVGLVRRVLPLRRIPEKENMLYCIANDIPFHHGECPYSGDAHRQFHRDMVMMAEEDTPGTRHAMVNAVDRIVELHLERGVQTEIGACRECGEPTTGETCRRCLYALELGLNTTGRE